MRLALAKNGQDAAPQALLKLTAIPGQALLQHLEKTIDQGGFIFRANCSMRGKRGADVGKQHRYDALFLFHDNRSYDDDIADILNPFRATSGFPVKIKYGFQNILLTRGQQSCLTMIDPGSKYVLFLNPDTVVLRPDWLEIMIGKLNGKVGITGQQWNRFFAPPLFGNIDMCCLLVKREVLEDILISTR